MTAKLFLLLVGLISLGHAVASDLDFTLVNDTPRSFEAVYLSSANNKDWDGNLLTTGKPLAAGGRLAVKFDGTVKTAIWDLNIVDSDGVSVTFEKLNLIDVEKVTLQVVAGKVTAVVE